MYIHSHLNFLAYYICFSLRHMCVYVRMHVRTHVCMMYIYIYMYVCMYVCMYDVCARAHVYVYTYIYIYNLSSTKRNVTSFAELILSVEFIPKSLIPPPHRWLNIDHCFVLLRAWKYTFQLLHATQRSLPRSASLVIPRNRKSLSRSLRESFIAYGDATTRYLDFGILRVSSRHHGVNRRASVRDGSPVNALAENSKTPKRRNAKILVAILR